MAWLSSMKFERGVLCEKGAVKKSPFFFNNYCWWKKGVFMKQVRRASLTAPFAHLLYAALGWTNANAHDKRK
jgi:hypothetical protein